MRSRDSAIQIAGVVLGAGLSERMGQPKQLMPYGNTTLLGATVAAAEASHLDRVVVVVGAAALEIETSLRVTRAKVVRNLRYHDGNLSSLLVGVEAAGEFDAVMLLLGDMPNVDNVLVDQLLTAWSERPVEIQVTSYSNGLGHPFILQRCVVEELCQLRGSKPLWSLIQERDNVRRVPVSRLRPIDVDTPEDYERLISGD